MNRLEQKIELLKQNKEKALVSYIMAGYPDISSTEEIFKTLTDAGTDIVELGIPFSDPIADGPTIQFASDKALRKGTGLKSIFRLVERIRRTSEAPVILMGYLNPLLRNGLEHTLKSAKQSGIDGFIIPDLIPEESFEIGKAFEKYGLSLIFLTAPNSTSKRLEYISSKSSPFVYVVSLTGVTGGRKNLQKGVKDFLLRTKKHINKPRFIGFGISKAKHVSYLKKFVDGVIVGSAFVDIIRNNKNKSVMHKKLSVFVKSLKKALS